MAEAAFFSKDARRRTAETVAAIEAETAAEIVVSVRRRSDTYRAIDLAVGFVLSLVVLLLLLFLPQAFPVVHFPLDVTVAFLVGALFSSNFHSLKRLLTPHRWVEEAVTKTAKAVFHDLGISRTRDRTGILVLVSTHERRVEVVTDTGVDTDLLGEAWGRALEHLGSAATRLDLEAFLAALLEIRPPLAEALPRREDDVNELPDALDTA